MQASSVNSSSLTVQNSDVVESRCCAYNRICIAHQPTNYLPTHKFCCCRRRGAVVVAAPPTPRWLSTCLLYFRWATSRGTPPPQQEQHLRSKQGRSRRRSRARLASTVPAPASCFRTRQAPGAPGRCRGRHPWSWRQNPSRRRRWVGSHPVFIAITGMSETRSWSLNIFAE